MQEFDIIKKIVTSPTYVKPFDLGKTTWLYTDGSKLYVAAYMLTQLTGEVNKKGEAIQHLIQRNLVTSTPEWSGYYALDVELLSLYWACTDTQ